MEFDYHPIVWSCTCGLKPAAVKVGISSLGTLTAEWRCPHCKVIRFAHFPLERLIESVPVQPGAVFTVNDLKELREMHILDEGDT